MLLNVAYPLDTWPESILLLNFITKYSTNPITNIISKNGPHAKIIANKDWKNDAFCVACKTLYKIMYKISIIVKIKILKPLIIAPKDVFPEVMK